MSACDAAIHFFKHRFEGSKVKHIYTEYTMANRHGDKPQPCASKLMPRQEKGIRKARPLPYQLYANGKLGDDKKEFIRDFDAGDELFKKIRRCSA